MSFYSMIFGKNGQSDILLAVIGLREVDVPRFRDAHVAEGGAQIAVYTRMGGGNRGHWDSYDGDGGPECACPGCKARWVLAKAPGYLYDEDDDFDTTYATYYFAIPEAFQADVLGLSDILANGLRKEFGEHLLLTLKREPTADDLERTAYDREAAELTRLGRHFKANGHTFVPWDDIAMEAALKLAEANDGSLRTCWGILPLQLTVKRDFHPYPNAKDERSRAQLTRVEVGYDYAWKVDRTYWDHCQAQFADAYPVTMAKVAEAVAQHLAKERA